jgi:two-component system, cell cycle sensor histidine kinase and response regulator CckA
VKHRFPRAWPDEPDVQRLADGYPDVILVHVDGEVTYANSAAARLLGVDGPADLVGRSLLDFADSATRGRIRRRVSAMLDLGRAAPRAEQRYRRLDGGGNVDVEVVSIPVTDRGRRAILCVARDITERREAEERLEESEERYRSLFEYNPAAVFSLDLAGRFTSANPAAYALTGYITGELLGLPFHRLVLPEQADRAAAHFQAALAVGTSQTLELTITHRDGRRLEVCVTTTPILIAGQTVGVFGIAEDITERVRAREALRKSEEMLRTVIDASPVAIVILDRDGRVNTWSAAAERIFGWTADEASERRAPWVTPETDAVFRAWLGRVVAGESLLGLELVRPRKDGVAVPISLSASPLRDAEGRVVGAVAAIADETERRLAELALQESQQQLLHAQKLEAVGRIAGGIAHDFNNLLTAIKGSAHLLLLDTPEGHPARPDLVEIDQAVDRATNLTRQLLTFSRKGVAEPRALDLNALLDSMRKLLNRVLRDDITLVTRVSGTACIVADRGQLEQVLVNLAVNARDAMPSGGRLILETIGVELRGPFGPEHSGMKPGRYVCLCVTDTGEGMTPEVQERAYEPFFTTKPQGEGTGLGLSTVYGIVQQSGGFIQLHTAPGRGTSFRIFLPEAPGACGEEASTPVTVAARARAETLLLVEDEPAVRKVVNRTLTRSGYRVMLAGTGEEAIQLCAREPGPDLLITDVVMPGMSGAELAQRARALKPGLPVLFISGYADEVVSHHGVLDDGVEFIQKPFSPQVLAARVREVLDGGLRAEAPATKVRSRPRAAGRTATP